MVVCVIGQVAVYACMNMFNNVYICCIPTYVCVHLPNSPLQDAMVTVTDGCCRACYANLYPHQGKYEMSNL